MAVQPGQRSTTRTSGSGKAGGIGKQSVPERGVAGEHGVPGQRAGRATPEAGGERSIPAFVGRERDLDAVAAALSDPPAMILVEGEAGIGKTRLLHEVLAHGGHRALVAACAPLPEPLTLSPIVDAVRQARETVAGMRLSALAGALRPLFPEWAAELPPAPEPLDDARAGRHRLFRALNEVLDGLGVSVLVVEDLHWADRATLEFLLSLNSGQQRPSLVVTYRPEDVSEGSLVLLLSSRPPADATHARLTLPPLDLAGTTKLVSSMLDGEPLSEEFATFLYEHTDGVPLAIEESVRLLRDRDDVVRRDGEWVRRSLDELQVPPTVRDLTLERVGRLPPAAQRALQALAVLAEPAAENIVTKVAGLSSSVGAAGLSAAVASGLVEEDARGWLRFRHVLHASAVNEAIPGPQRRRLHLRAGQALEDVEPLPVAQLSRHFREAGETSKWAEYAEHAAERAVASNDHTTGARLLNDVLTAAALPAYLSARLAPKLARATLIRTEAVDDLNRDVVRTLRTILDSAELSPVEQVEIRSPLGRLLTQVGDWVAGYRELESAASNLGHDPVEAARVMTYLGLPLVGPWPASVHRKWLRRAAQLDPSVGSAVDRIMLTADRAMALLFLGEEDGWELAAALPATASNAEERRELTRAHSNLAIASLRWGRYADARQRMAIALGIARADGHEKFRYRLLVTEVQLDWFTGAWDGLAERLTALLDLDEIRPSSYGGVLCAVAQLGIAQGARGQAEDRFCLALDEAQRLGTADDAPEPAAGLGRLRLAEGRVDDALQVTDKPMQMVLTKEIWIWATEIAPVRVEALVAAERVEEVGRLVGRFARGLRGCNAPAPRAGLATCRALLLEGSGDHDRAAAAFARAARAWERLPRPYDALLARERQGRCLLAGNKTESGLSVLSDVFHGLRDLGARADADRVAHELRQHGVRVPRPWRGGRRGYGDQLSPRELEVVRLVAAGRTNREIAETLSKSPRTVERQLGSAMEKLGVSSRTALAVAATERGLTGGDPSSVGA